MRARRSRSLARGASLAAMLAYVYACADEFPSNVYRFSPPSQYALWWSEAEACSGTSGDLSRVRWYRTPEGVALEGSEGAGGWYFADGHRIAIAGDYVDNARLVRHEMLHALHPTVRHPRDLFLSRCGDVVPCGGDCLAEAGGVPIIPPEVRRVLPAQLEVRIHATPAVPSRALFNGHFAIVVVARNPFNEPVMVNFPDSASLSRTRTFGYRLSEDPIGSLAWYHDLPYDRSAGYFRAGESKRAVFDFKIQDSTGSTFPRPGPHYAFGVFGNKLTDTIRFVIGGSSP